MIGGALDPGAQRSCSRDPVLIGQGYIMGPTYCRPRPPSGLGRDITVNNLANTRVVLKEIRSYIRKNLQSNTT